MAGVVDQRVLQALELVYGADTPVAQRREAETICQQLKEDVRAPVYGIQLACASNGYSPMARHFGLQLIEHALRHRWTVSKKSNNQKLSVEECVQLRDQVWELVFDACPRPGVSANGDPQYIKEKLVSLMTMLIIRVWPSVQWSDLSAQLLHLYSMSGAHREMALRIWQTLGEELFVYDRDTVAAVRKSDLTNGIIGALLPRTVVAELYPSGYRLSTDPAVDGNSGKVASAILLEPGNEEGWVLRWLQHAGELAQQGQVDGDGETQLCALVDTTATFLEWLPVKALVATGLIPRLAVLLGVRNGAVRQRVAAALEIVSRRNASAGDDRDAVLLQFVESDSGSAIAAVAHAYASTLHPAVDAEWDDATDALNAAQNLSQICANLVTLHWARPKLENNVIAQPAALVELLMALSRDPRYTVSSLALTSWASLIKHSALCRVPAVAASFSALTESTTEGLFQVCRAAHLLAGAQTDSAGIDEAESDQFDSPAELRLFLNSVVRMRMLNIIRGMCALDPAGFVQWIMPSLLPVFSQVPSGPVDVGRMSVVEAAFMIVDSILTTLDETEQRALENGSEDAMDQIQKARGPCYQLGQQIVQLASDDTQLLGRQLQTLPSFTFLLRPAAMEWTEARELLLAVLQRCATCLKFPLSAPNVRDLRQVARRATAALVRIAVAIPDSLMLVYADLQQLVQDRLSDPEVVGTVKSHLTEFQLALIAGASCTLAQRRELARPVIQPLIDELCEYLPHLQSPADFIVLLGLPALDQACVQGVESPHAAMDEARVRRNGLSHVLSTLFICLNRTLGDQGTSEHSLAPLWSDYVGDVVPVLLLTIRSLHALWNPEHWQGLPWQSAQARSNLFGLLEMSPAERQSIAGAAGQCDDAAPDAAGAGADGTVAAEIRAAHHALVTLREYSYKSLGRLAHIPDAFSASKIPDVAANFTGCLFADAQHMAARHWRLLLADVTGPILGTIGDWPGQNMQLDDSVRAIGEFAAAWLEPLFAFCTESLGSEWKDLRARGVASTLSDEDGAAGRQKGSNESTSVTDDMVHEKVVRDWTRAWSQQILGRLLASIGMWFPEAAQIENELASSSRVTAAAAPAKLAKHQQQGNRALGAYVLGAPSVLASALTASLGALKYNDTASASRVLAQLAVMAPSLLLVSLLPMYQPPTPAHASITSSYCARIQGSAPNAGDRCSDLFAWLAADLPNALVDVLRDASLVDLQDAALSLLADLAFTSAAVASRMPIHWSFRNSSGAADQRASAIPLTASIVPVGDPGLVYRQTVVRTMAPALQAAGVAAEEVDQTLTQLAASPAADTKHRRALLKIALQPLLAVEKSKLFSERDPKPAKPSAGRAALDGGLKHVAPASWTNKHDGQSTSVLDNDAQFDLGSLMP